MFLNKVFLIGNLTKDPELKSLPSGQAVVNFGIATNRTWKDPQGQKHEQAEFHNITAYGKQAEVINQYMRKGSSLFVEGRIQTRSWDAQDGSKRFRTDVVIENFQFGPKPQGAGAYSAGGNPPTGSNDTGQPAPKEEEVATIEYPEGGDEINPDDIPF